MRTLRDGQRVTYDLQEDRRGKMAAVNLKEAAPAADEPAKEEGNASESAANDQAE